jgi:uncharacterized protein
MTATLRVRVTPRAGRTELVRLDEGVLHVRIAAPPVEGAANAALVASLADALGLRKSEIAVKRGAASRDKLVEFAGIGEDDLGARVRQAIGKERRR